MKITIEAYTHGEGQYGEAMVAHKISRDGTVNKTILCNVGIRLLGLTGDGENYLFHFGDDLPTAKTIKVLKKNDLRDKHTFFTHFRPFSFFGTASDYEYFLNFLLSNYRAQGDREFIYVQNLMGKVEDFWILDRFIFFPKQKGETTKVVTSTPLKKVNTVEGLFLEFVDCAIWFDDGRRMWYVVDIGDIPRETRPMNNYNLFDRAVDEFSLSDKELVEMWAKQYGNRVLNMAVLGWFTSLVHQGKVRACLGRDFFPFFAISGLTQTGKTSLINNYFKFWGLEPSPTDYTQTSGFVEIKQLQQFSQVPIWRDEFRENIGYSKGKETILRSIYSNVSIAKGTSNQKLIHYKTRSTLFLSGEDLVLDPAVRRRCIYFLLDSKFKMSADAWDVVVWNSTMYFPQLFYLIATKSFEEKAFRYILDIAKKEIKTPNDVGEEGLCYAALGAVFGVGFGVALVENAKMYWESEIGGSKITLNRGTIAGELFRFANSVLAMKGYFATEDRFGKKSADIVNFCYYNKYKDVFYLKMDSFVDMLFGLGFYRKTTLSSRSIMAALMNEVKSTKITPYKMGNGMVWESVIIRGDVVLKHDDWGIRTFFLNVKKAVEDTKAYSNINYLMEPNDVADITPTNETLLIDGDDITQAQNG